MTKSVIRKQIRLKEYDYSSSGYYFITVCSINQENIFGIFAKNEIDVGSLLACDQNKNPKTK